MAEVLIFARPAFEGGDLLDTLRGAYQEGDPVVVMPDGHEWGREEALPPDEGGRFFILKIPGATVEEVKSLTEPLLDAVTGQMLRRRGRSLPLQSLPAADRAAARRNGQINLPWQAVEARLERKIIGVRT